MGTLNVTKAVSAMIRVVGTYVYNYHIKSIMDGQMRLYLLNTYRPFYRQLYYGI